MEDPTTIALNLTFFGTLGVALVMFLGLFAVFVATLVIAGIGRLAAVTVWALAGGVARVVGTASASIRTASPASPAGPADAPSPVSRPSMRPTPDTTGRREPPQLSADWAAAVAREDARAAARAKAEAAPAVKVSVRDLPSPTAPVQEISEVAPLVESATDRNGGRSAVPHAFEKPAAPVAKKPTGPAAWSLLDADPPAPVPGRPPTVTAKRQAPARNHKAG
ncbi:hypothetical protein [Pseudarthrobacter sp. MM222]|uniref:hypothetical protein n=1 Tax=Pseudarthrobacter sp. MM222 TaxID=3018929 RepID=UPI002220E0D2|nr:hypothetical protein [Pseudarthrobacter sp. MM222]CAI3805106.1 hypothetical protein NKCBBBOE_03773 [Pseudarthrobacter sp. MM222]